MINLKPFLNSISQIAEEKGISQDQIIEVIEAALATAYRKDYGKKGQIFRTKLDLNTGKFKIFQVKLAVDDSMLKKEEEEKERKKSIKKISQNEKEEVKKIKFNTDRHIMIDEAKKIKKDVKPGEEILIPTKSAKEFGRIAAQSAKQVIIQRLKEAEKKAILEEFKNKEGEIISGIVQRFEAGNVYFDLGKTTAIMHPEEKIPGEHYKIGNRLRFLILKVEESKKGSIIFVSRAHPDFVKKLFELEVPEIAAGSIEIKAIVREPGVRSKVAVKSNVESIDPIGSCVGQKGTRINTIINELFGEKVDIIEWSDKPKELIANALSPAKILTIELEKKKRKAKIIVPEDQISLVIGRGGQNVRLASKLSGWKLDIRSAEKPDEIITTEEEKTKNNQETKEKITENKKNQETKEEITEETKEEIVKEAKEDIKK